MKDDAVLWVGECDQQENSNNPQPTTRELRLQPLLIEYQGSWLLFPVKIDVGKILAETSLAFPHQSVALGYLFISLIYKIFSL